jgi:DNA-binding transcriptional ArsR family regulator
MDTQAHAETDAFADGHPFMDVFGSPGRTKIIAAFVSERNREITISYIARLAGIARSTVYEHIDDLKEVGIIEQIEDRGNSTYYTLNMDNDLAHELYRLEGIAFENRQNRNNT